MLATVGDELRHVTDALAGGEPLRPAAGRLLHALTTGRAWDDHLGVVVQLDHLALSNSGTASSANRIVLCDQRLTSSEGEEFLDVAGVGSLEGVAVGGS